MHFWKSDGNDQKTFKETSLALPYLFNSPIGIKQTPEYLDKTLHFKYKENNFRIKL
jgi:hypothetical protein